jgi:hypothetical protein
VSVADGDDSERPRAAGGESVWSSDDLPARDEPLDIVWKPRRVDDADPITLQPLQPLRREPSTDAAPGTAPGRSPGSKLLIAGAALAAVAVVVGLATRGGGDDGSTTTQTTVAMPSSSLPTTIETVPPTTSTPPVGGPVGPVEVELPEALASMEAPTEIVALTPDGTALTLSLPSGRVRWATVSASDRPDSTLFGGGDIIVAPDAAALGMLDTTFVILPRTGPPIDLDREAFGDDVGGMNAIGWQQADDGSTRFTVVAYPNNGNDVRFVSVGLAGDVRELPAKNYGLFGSTFGTPEGDWIVNDVGGAYEVDSQGRSVRIDDGTVYAAAGDHRVVRTCDAQRQCSTVLVTVSTGERRPLDTTILPDDFDELVWGMSLSPDGGAVAATRSRSTQERVLVDFEKGEVATIPINTWSQVSAWAADSSGIFSISPDGQGLQFIDRSGQTVDFGEDLGQIIAIGVRHPASELGPVASVVDATITPARPLGPTGLTLVGAGRAGGMSRLDIDAGTMRSWETTRRLGQDPATLLPLGDAVVVLPGSANPSFVSSPGLEDELGDAFTFAGDKFPGPTDDTVWVREQSGDPALAYRLAAIDGTRSADIARIDLIDDVPIGSDGRGGLVVDRGGDVFVVGAGGTERLTSGELIAIGAGAAFVRECDDAMTCSVVRIDRSTGERTAPDLGIDPQASVRGAQARGSALGSSVSPDGEVLVVQVRVTTTDPDGTASSDDEWFFVDSATGRATAISRFHATQPVVWNSAGTFAAVLAGSTVQIYDRAAGELVPLDAASLVAIGPASPRSATSDG